MQEDTSSLMVPIGTVLFVTTLFIVYYILSLRFVWSFLIAIVCSGSAASMLSSTSSDLPPLPPPSEDSKKPRYVFTKVDYMKKRASEQGLTAALKVIEAVANKKKSALGEDISIFPEEKPKLVDLRNC